MRRSRSPGNALTRTMRAIRHEQRLDQLSLALAMGAADASYLSRLERGARGNPSTRFLGRLVRAYDEIGCSLSPDQRARLAAAALLADPPAPSPQESKG